MKAVEFKGQTTVLRPPKGFNEEHELKCGGLPVEMTPPPDGGPYFTSVWKPTADDIERLTTGGYIILTVWGFEHPPVSVQVGSAEELP